MRGYCKDMRKNTASPASFTLIELLIVIAILAVLAIAVVLILNPTELLKESRDTTRIEALAVVNKALALVETDTPSASLGTSTVVYISIPDSSATCSNLGLPTLPAGYTYACAPTSTLTKTDGTGWIPVSFDSLSFGVVFVEDRKWKFPLPPIPPFAIKSRSPICTISRSIPSVRL